MNFTSGLPGSSAQVFAGKFKINNYIDDSLKLVFGASILPQKRGRQVAVCNRQQGNVVIIAAAGIQVRMPAKTGVRITGSDYCRSRVTVTLPGKTFAVALFLTFVAAGIEERCRVKHLQWHCF